jgi:hypothetical protein
VEVRDGVVWVCPQTHYTDGDAHWRNRVRAEYRSRPGQGSAGTYRRRRRFPAYPRKWWRPGVDPSKNMKAVRWAVPIIKSAFPVY